MQFGKFEPTLGDWKKAKKEEKPQNIEELDVVLKQLKNRVEEIYQKNEEISEQEIREIRELLATVPNLVINFDDTITQPPLSDPPEPGVKAKVKENQSIAMTAKLIGGNHPEKMPEFREFAQKIKDSKKGIPFEKVQFFYEKCVSGVSKEELMQVCDRVVKENDQYKEVRFNQNFFDICRKMKETRGITRIPLFVLSLNTPDLIQKFYEENQQQLDDFEAKTGIKIEVAAIVGNQVTYDDDGNINGVIEHVRDHNKKDYIPEGSIILADNRETLALIKEGVNAVNIQGEALDLDVMDISLKINEISQKMTELGLHNDKTLRDLLDLLKNHGFHAKNINETRNRGKKSDDMTERLREEVAVNIEKFNNYFEIVSKRLNEAQAKGA